MSTSRLILACYFSWIVRSTGADGASALIFDEPITASLLFYITRQVVHHNNQIMCIKKSQESQFLKVELSIKAYVIKFSLSFSNVKLWSGPFLHLQMLIRSNINNSSDKFKHVMLCINFVLNSVFTSIKKERILR